MTCKQCGGRLLMFQFNHDGNTRVFVGESRMENWGNVLLCDECGPAARAGSELLKAAKEVLAVGGLCPSMEKCSNVECATSKLIAAIAKAEKPMEAS